MAMKITSAPPLPLCDSALVARYEYQIVTYHVVEIAYYSVPLRTGPTVVLALTSYRYGWIKTVQAKDTSRCQTSH